eukprot:CAMPEP_0206329808 /NCGR_PEP_ID=MMETSP0106_2-20121207/23384_1 /ASSEMBLY_ACC=CAM_ASM_000206 /TAXON_ID=81532 /ORGANISM="Acanthoeca-like sp., Strain 10tr" /LENGTH=1429 /DNA_ID=CAMNT_0053762527 /DNA_START=453 /DNA_END=4741 /DNA_ORIENTATION=-
MAAAHPATDSPAAGAVPSTRPRQTPQPVMQIRLVDYLAGHCLRTALMAFEDAVGPWVKRVLAGHYPPTAKDAQQAADADARRRSKADRRAKLESQLHSLEHQLRGASKSQKELRRDIATKKQAVVKELKAIAKHDAADAASTPAAVPKWVAECRTTAGPKTAPHIHAHNRWDTHTIVVVMQAYLKTVFGPLLPDVFHAKEMLTQMEGLLVARFKRAHRVELVEAGVLGALNQAATVLGSAMPAGRGPAAAAALHEVTNLLDEAKRLVDVGRGDTDVVCAGPTLSAEACNAQLFYEGVTSWETHVERELGTEVHYQDGTIAFGDKLNAVWTAAVKGVKKELAVVAQARHWYFHHLDGDIDFIAVYDAMALVTDTMDRDHQPDPHSHWTPPVVMDAPSPLELHLAAPSPQATVSVSRVREIVGRHVEIQVVTAMVVSADGGSGSRVLIHGPPGVGKDTVMAEVAHSAEVRELGGLQGWLQASSDVVFRRQLIGLFGVHRPSVVHGKEDNEQVAIEAIRQWLAGTSEWVLFVEDAGLGTTTLWEVLPGGTAGHAIVTSQQDLHTAHRDFGDTRLELTPITTDDSIEMFRRMNVFSRKAPTPPDNEDEAALEARCTAAGAQEVYTAAPPNERARKRKERRRTIETKLFEHAELSRPEFRHFLHDTLGNLPLSVSLCGHMLRADRGLRGVLDLIELYGQLELAEVDKHGRNPQQDKHYFGLQLSIRINLDRLMTAADVAEEERRAAAAVLAAVSMLHHALTPESLLIGHDMSTVWGKDVVFNGLSEDNVDMMPFMAVFMDKAMLYQARETCVRYGLLRHGNLDHTIGVMHQQVHEGLRRELVGETKAGHLVALAVRRMLRARFTFNQETPPAEWPAQRQLVPCVSAWCNIAVCDLAGKKSKASVAAVSEEMAVHILTAWGSLALHADGNAAEAESVWSKALILAKQILPPDDPSISIAMGLVAQAQWHLGKNDDALLAEERVLARDRRRLPSDDPRIGVSMANLMTTYHALGRLEDAARLGEETVAFMQWVHRRDHRHVATSLSNLGAVYSDLGRHEDALQLKQDCLDIEKRILAPDDPTIAVSLSNLMVTYLHLERNDDAVRVGLEGLALARQVLPSNHPDLSAYMGNLASVYFKLDRLVDALHLAEHALAIRTRALPPHHTDIATSLHNIMTIYHRLGRLEEAVRTGEDALAMFKRLLPPNHPHIAACGTNLSLVHTALHMARHDDAMQPSSIRTAQPSSTGSPTSLAHSITIVSSHAAAAAPAPTDLAQPPTVSVPPTVPAALMAFEDAVGPWVKAAMAKHFPDTPDDLQRAVDHSAAVAGAAAAAKVRADYRAELEARLQSLEQQLRGVAKVQRKAIAAKKQVVVTQLELLDKSDADHRVDLEPPPPRWVAKCRETAGHKTAPHIKADKRWDTHIIVVVMQANLKDVFAP